MSEKMCTEDVAEISAELGRKEQRAVMPSWERV